MNNGRSQRRPRRRRFNPKKLAALLSVVLLLGMAVGGTVAYLIADSQEVTNTFTPGHVDCVVTKNNGAYTIAPDSQTNTNVYLRAAVVGNWVDDEGNIYWQAPTFSVSGSGWDQKSDGYYYYQSEVAPGGAANDLTVTLTSEKLEGYTFQVEILAEAIQSTPAGQVAWDKNGVKEGG